MDYEIFELGATALQTGATLPDAKLAYKTYGNLNDDGSNVVVYPTRFGGMHYDNEWLIGTSMALNPEKYFIVVPNMLGNGLSSSPSNTPPPYDRAYFPLVTTQDNVRLQHRLLTECLGIEKVALVTGYSMGAQQTFQWAASYPQMVERILPFCGSARTSVHNFVFLEGVKAALTADTELFKEGRGANHSTTGLRAFARVYAGWALSQTFYRERVYLELGYSSLEDFLVAFWEGNYVGKDADDLLAMIRTWQSTDIGTIPEYDGDFEAALRAIGAKAIVMPGETDLYFPPEDNEYEVTHMPSAEHRPIPSIWGHFAGSGRNPTDVKFINNALAELLAS